MSGPVGKLVVISGPSGAGKTSVCQALKQRPNCEFSISATTRKPRAGERAGVDYLFLDRPEFERRAAAGDFLEWASYNGNLYGTPRWPMTAALAQGRIFLLEIEVNGTRQLRQQGLPGLYIFIAPPSLDDLRRRLQVRGTDAPAEIEARVRIAAEEIAAAHSAVAGRPLYDHVIVNEVLSDAIRRVEELIGV